MGDGTERSSKWIPTTDLVELKKAWHAMLRED
jgi:hypothetical protein